MGLLKSKSLFWKENYTYCKMKKAQVPNNG